MSKQVGVLLYDEAQPMDIIGPWEVFSFWKGISPTPFDMHLISEKGQLVQCDNGITLKAHYDFEHAPKLDYLIVPGGRGRHKEVHNPALLAFIQKQAKECEYILSVCTGMFLLYSAGILKSQSVTTYWRALPEAKQFQDVHIEEKRIVKNEKIWMSGGVTSGIDLALEFIAETAGKEAAGKVQLLLEYFPQGKWYATAGMAANLPPYNDKNEPIILPAYIKDHL